MPSLLAADPDSGETDWKEVARGFRGAGRHFAWLAGARLVEYPDRKGVALIGRKRLAHPSDPNASDTGDEAPADGEGNSFVGTKDWVQLGDHCRGVQTEVEQFARSLALRDDVGKLLSRAALLHDAGKADPGSRRGSMGAR